MSAQDRRLDFLDNVVLVAIIAAMITTALLVYSTWFAPPQNITPTIGCRVACSEWTCIDANGERTYTYDCHAQETAAVVAERRLAECLDVLRLCARVTARYEAGAQVCKPDQLKGGLP